MPVQALYETPAAMPAVTTTHSRRVSAPCGDGYRLDDGGLARLATSCLLAPLPGDLVLVAGCAEGLFILHVLAREAGQDADLGVAGAGRLRIGHARLDLHASQSLAVRSLKDLDLQAVTGSLSLSARNLVVTALESLLEQVRQRITLADEICLRAKGLLKLHGGDGLITAERDLRIDGERINVG